MKVSWGLRQTKETRGLIQRQQPGVQDARECELGVSRAVFRHWDAANLRL